MKSFRSKASRFFRHGPSSDEKSAINEQSRPVLSAGIDRDNDPVLNDIDPAIDADPFFNDIDPAIDAAIDATLRASVKAGSKKLNWFFGTEAEKVERTVSEQRFRSTPPSSPKLSKKNTACPPSADDFDHLPEYNDDSDDEITALPQLPSPALPQNRTSGSSLAQAIERNDPNVPQPLSPRLRRTNNTLSQSNEVNSNQANENESPPVPPPKVEPQSVKSATCNLCPQPGQNGDNGSTYSLLSKTGRHSVNGSTIGLLNEYNRTETPHFLSATPEPSRNKGGFTGLARLKKSYANLKSKSSYFFKKEHVPSPPPPPLPPQISVDIDMATLFGPTKDAPDSKPTKNKVTKPLPKAAVKPPLKSPSTPHLVRPSTAVASKTAPQVRTLGISRPQALPSSPSLFSHFNFSAPAVIPPRPHTAVSNVPTRPLRPQSLDHDTVSLMQDPASRMHLARQVHEDGSVAMRVQREPMHTIESRLGLPTGFASPQRDSQVLASSLAAQVPEHTSLRESSGVDIPFRYSQYDEAKAKERASVESKGKGKEKEKAGYKGKGKERASVAEEEDAASVYSQEEEASIELENGRASDRDKVEWICACGATDCGSSSTAVVSTAVASTAVVEEQADDMPRIERYSVEQEGIWVLEKKVSREEGGGMVFRHASGSFHYVPNV